MFYGSDLGIFQIIFQILSLFSRAVLVMYYIKVCCNNIFLILQTLNILLSNNCLLIWISNNRM